MMYAARSLASWSVRLGLPPFAGIGIDFGSPAWGWRPLVMIWIRNAGASVFVTPGGWTIGLSTAPMPPSRLAPWQVALFAPYSVAPWVGSPGRATVGDGEASASVVIAVSASMAGIASATRAETLKPLTRRMPPRS